MPYSTTVNIAKKLATFFRMSKGLTADFLDCGERFFLKITKLVKFKHSSSKLSNVDSDGQSSKGLSKFVNILSLKRCGNA